MDINGNNGVKEFFGGSSQEVETGKEYFLQFRIKQIEEKLNQARLREAENQFRYSKFERASRDA
jgi:hypothetical protein